MPDFGPVDIAIVVFYLALSVGIGLLANRFITGLTGYLVAGRSLGTALSVATMTGSELGLITVMYQAQKGFTGGFAALHIGLIAGVVTLVVGLTGFIVVGLRRTGVMTIPEFYARRFGKDVRVTGGILLALGGILNMGLFLQVGSQFVVGVTGLDPGGGTVALVMTVLLGLVLFYTVLGGMVSVVLTDYVQFVVLSLGLVALVLLAIQNLGYDHIAQVWEARRGADTFDPRAQFGGAVHHVAGRAGPRLLRRLADRRHARPLVPGRGRREAAVLLLGHLVHGPLPAPLLPRHRRLRLPRRGRRRRRPGRVGVHLRGRRARQHHGAADLHAAHAAGRRAGPPDGRDARGLHVDARQLPALLGVRHRARRHRPAATQGRDAAQPAALDADRHRADRRLRPRVGHLLQAEPGRLGLPGHHRGDLLHGRDRRPDGRALLEAGEPHGRALGAPRGSLGGRRPRAREDARGDRGRGDPQHIGLGTLGLAVLAMVAGSLLFPDRDRTEEVA